MKLQFLKKAVYFIFSNFGPLLGFYIINYLGGVQLAIAASLLLIFSEFTFLKIKKKHISLFFYFSCFIVALFGTIDLIFPSRDLLLTFEAPLTNLLFAIFFGLSLFKDRSLVQEFAEAQDRVSKEQSPDKKFFFQLFTLAWCVYFLLKASFYLWIHLHDSLEHALLIQALMGPTSFGIMMFISLGLPKQIWILLEKLKMFPSQKDLKVRHKPTLQLVRPQEKLYPAFKDFVEDMNINNEPLWDPYLPKCNESTADFVLRLNQRESNPEAPLVPETIYWATYQNSVVGRISLRHQLNAQLSQLGGHIGYEVSPKWRRRGFATQMLRQILLTDKAREIKMLLLTCSPDNIASNKTILANGGKLDKTIFVDFIKEERHHYWVKAP